MARDNGTGFSSTFDDMLDDNRQRLDDLLGRRPSATVTATPKPRSPSVERSTGRRTGSAGGRNFSVEVDVSHKKQGAIAMALPNVGDQAPAFSMRNQQGADTTLEQYKGHYVVLWWYPKADTPG